MMNGNFTPPAAAGLIAAVPNGSAFDAVNKGKACQEDLWNAGCTTTIDVPSKATVTIKSHSSCTIKQD